MKKSTLRKRLMKEHFSQKIELNDFIKNNIEDKDYDDFAMFVEAEFGFDLYHEDPYGLWNEEELNSWLSAWLKDREDPEGRELMNENTKITLTVGQLKRLVNENSYYPDWDYCLEYALDWCSNEKKAIENILNGASCEWKFRVCEGFDESEWHCGHALVSINLDKWYHIYGYDIYSKGNKVTDEEFLAAAKAQGVDLLPEELKSIHENIDEISDRVMTTAHEEDPGNPWVVGDDDWIDRDRD